MIEYEKVTDNQLKSKITNDILRQLPEWFGIESSIVEYVEGVQDKPFYMAKSNQETIGFLSIKKHNAYTADIYVFGILKPFHRQGIGKHLVQLVVQDLEAEGYKILMVKTLGPSSDYEYYGRTRKFYEGIGFYPLEEFKEIWDEENPCLIMVKPL